MSNHITTLTAVQEFKSGWRVLLVAAMGVTCGITAVPIYTIGAFVGPLYTHLCRTSCRLLNGSLWAQAGGLVVCVWYFYSGW